MSALTPFFSRRLIGVAQVATSGFAFGFLGVFGKIAFRNHLSVGELLSYRFLVATLGLGLALALFSRRRLAISHRELAVCAGLGLFGYAVFSTFYFAALEGVSVAMASLLLYTYPVLVALGAHIFFNERLTKIQVIALPIAVLGLLILLGGGLTLQDSRFLPIASGLAAAVCYAGYILVSSHFQKEIDPLTSGFYVMLFATLGLFLFHRPDIQRIPSLTTDQGLVIIGIAIICTITPLVLFLSGLQKLGNTEASLLSTIEPVTAAALGALLLKEALSSHEWLGGTLVLTALVVTVLGHRRPPPVEQN